MLATQVWQRLFLIGERMKIANQEAFSTPNQVTVNINRGDKKIPILLTSLPLSWTLRFRDGDPFKFPPVPVEVVKDKHGTVLRDSNSQARYEENPNNQEYVKECATSSMRLAFVELREMLRCDPSISFDSVKPTAPLTETKVWTDYADSLIAEFNAADLLTYQEVIALIARGRELNNSVDSEKLRDFS
jgi:hypothetical protein